MHLLVWKCMWTMKMATVFNKCFFMLKVRRKSTTQHSEVTPEKKNLKWGKYLRIDFNSEIPK